MKACACKPGASNQRRKRVFLLEDHPITRFGLMQLINLEPDLLVCGEAESAQQALAAIKSLLPDVILADMSLPGKSGLEFIKDLQRCRVDIPVLVLSMHDEGIYAERALRAGARGYLMKSEGRKRLLDGIRRVLRGEVCLSPGISTAIIGSLVRRHCPAPESSLSGLTAREFEIFQVIGQGLSTQEISRCLGISIKTVGTHRVHIKEKLQIHSSTELVRHAVRWVTSSH